VAVTLAEMVGEAGADVTIPEESALETLFSEGVGRVVVETTDVDAVREEVGSAGSVERIGEPTDSGRLELAVGDETLSYSADRIAALRGVIDRELE